MYSTRFHAIQRRNQAKQMQSNSGAWEMEHGQNNSSGASRITTHTVM